MLLRDGTGGLEVLLLRRSDELRFAPGAHVFPGGAIDDTDADPLLADGDLGAARLAAVRECLEETGVLLATTADGRPLRPDHPAVAAIPRLRSEVESGQRSLGALARSFDLRLGTGSLRFVSSWVTPEISPIRYDVRFFATAMPPGQRPHPDGSELVDATWFRPAEGIAAHDRGEVDLIEPTRRSLELLGRFPTTASALGAFDRGQASPARIRESSYGERIVVPGDDHAHEERP